MTNFTDIFIKRPVLATVVSLLIFLLGLRAAFDLQIRQFPKLENTVITITTSYPGASAQVMQGFITTPIQQSVASADGIDYMVATSTLGTSTIKVYVDLNYDPNTAFTDVSSKVASVVNVLPPQAQQPVLEKSTGQTFALMYIGFKSDEMSSQQITDYLQRAVQPKLETIPGVAQAQILGNRVFAMRVWLNPKKMAAFNVTPQEVSQALEQNNFQSAAGATKGQFVSYSINANTDLHDLKSFENLVVKSDNNTIVRLKDVAIVKLGAEQYDASVSFNGQSAVFIGITATPEANPLTVIDHVRKMLPALARTYPPTLQGKIVYDSTKYIRASIEEVIKTIFEAGIIVIIVIFLFLGSFRSITIPVVTIPLSLVGVCSLMLALNYSLNTLTLLAMVLAIGLVVDDAIVVVENIHRHIEDGMGSFKAALAGAREIATPIIAMTITLAAVYAPIGFMSGLTGSLFKEFALTLAFSVIISGIIALTLSPMMCSKFLASNGNPSRLVRIIDSTFDRLKNLYKRVLHSVLNYRPVIFVFAVVVLTSCFFLYSLTQKELAPPENQTIIFVSGQAPEYANADYVSTFSKQLNGIYESFKNVFSDSFIINGAEGVTSLISGMLLKPWNERKETSSEIKPLLQKKIAQIAGLQIVAFEPPPLPGSDSGLPIQFVLQTTASFKELYPAMEEMLKAAEKSGLFGFAKSTLEFNKPQLIINIDNSKAATLGLKMEDIGQALENSLSGNYTNFFSMEGRSYKVIPLMQRLSRFNPDDLKHIYVKSTNGDMIPLSTVVTIKKDVQPNQLQQFQQLNAASIQGVPAPGVTMGQALDFLKTTAEKILPKNIAYDYSGQSRQYVQEGNTLLITFIFALIIIYLVLAAQFESFRDPWIILISVPMSICGALIPLNLGAATINIYTQVGLITLIGLISKHGILMVDFANQLQENEGLSIRKAIEKSASIRLRPILMTTAAMVLGVLPLVFATGAGAASRYCIGLVIASGMSIGTLFTLFVVPTMYTLIATDFNKAKSQT